MPHIDTVEMDALLEWKANYISRASQQMLRSWNAVNNSSVCDSWVGVSCDPSGHHIQGLDLSGKGLAGFIAPHLGNLTLLSILDLSNNSFTGHVPSQLGGCIALNMLDLHSNMLSAPIPPSLASLPSLELLNLCDNSLAGPIPLDMFANSNASSGLQALGLCVNALTGSMPSDLGLHLPNLQTLLLWHNNLTGAIPPSLASCVSLIDLELHANQLSSPIPNRLHLLQSLQILYLHQNKLTGPIPPSLANCTSLIELTLNSNQLTGPIPSQFHLLHKLQLLYLHKNTLVGPIPPSLGNSTNLVELFLYSNRLTGPIPTQFCGGSQLQNLEILNLDENQLTGAIPPNLGNCTHLRILNLFSNQLTGPIPNQLSNLQNLQVLELMQNNLSGPIPSGLSNCTKLMNLDLSFNELRGHIPAQISFLSHLEFLNLGTNRLTGIIPPALASNCTSLITLELNDNELSGVVPAELCQLGVYQKLQLSYNKLTGAIPLSVGNCTQLSQLDFASNQLTSFIPSSSLQMLAHLETLQLSGNKFSGPLFQLLDFSNFTNLAFLQLQSNELSGSLSSTQFSNLQQLYFLDLGSNHLTGEIPWDSFSNCTFLYTLSLFDNRLTGRISSSLGKHQGLQYLYLGGNMLHGEIPNFEGSMSLLELDLSSNRLNGTLQSSLAHTLVTLAISLDLSHNELSGSLPLWLGSLVMVQTIDLSKNSFTGGIPPELGYCAALQALSLSHNQLSGGLPPELGNLTNLESIDLSSNHLSGTLPSFLATKLLHLKLLNISFNNFSGPIPSHEGVFRHLNASCFQGNPGLCGPILNKECTDMPFTMSMQQEHNHSILHLRKWKGIVVITFTIFLMVSLLLVAVSWRYFRHAKVDKELVIIDRLAGSKRYSARELMESTQGYSEANLLGQGGFSQVYKGVLGNGKIVAVKKLKDIDNIGSQESFLREMKILSKLRHRNLVQIWGCVLNLDVKALVLQYMEKGSLEQYLEMHFDEAGQMESYSGLCSYWEMVSRVAVSVAQALAYLHHEYGVPIIHGDVKPSNILFDSDLEPHLADFGLAKLIQRGATTVSFSSQFKGSIGYMAPEYAYTTRITTKVDVYSYGIVLLRMLTGRSPIEDSLDGVSLHQWVKSKLLSLDQPGQGGAAAADCNVDELLLHKSLFHEHNAISTYSSYSLDQEYAQKLVRMGVACTAHHPDDRPTIQQVLAFFTSTIPITVNDSPNPNEPSTPIPNRGDIYSF